MDESFAAVTQNNWDNCCGFNENGRGLPGSISFNRLLKQYQRRRRAKTKHLECHSNSVLCLFAAAAQKKLNTQWPRHSKAIHIQKCRHRWASAHYWKYGGFNAVGLVIEYNSIKVHFSFTMAQIWIAAPNDRMRCTLLWRSLPRVVRIVITVTYVSQMRFHFGAGGNHAMTSRPIREREIHAPVCFCWWLLLSLKCTAADRCKTQSKQSNRSHLHCDTTDLTVCVSQLSHIAQCSVASAKHPSMKLWEDQHLPNWFQDRLLSDRAPNVAPPSCQSQWKVDWSCEGDPAGSVHSLTQHFNIKSVIVETSQATGTHQLFGCATCAGSSCISHPGLR